MADVPLKFKASVDANQFEAGMRSIQRGGEAAASKVTGAFRNLLGPLAAIGPAIAAAFTGRAIVRGVAQVFEAGRALEVMHRQTGASIAGLVILKAKFKEAGLDSDAVATSIFRLQKSIAGIEDEENKGGASKLEKLGLNLAALQKLAPDQQLMAVGRAIAGIADPAERTATAMQIFGRSGAQLGALFKGDFGNVSAGLAAKAASLQRNALLFEQVSIKLEKAGNILKTFYAGAAPAIAAALDPILDRINKVNLVEAGKGFGDAVAKGMTIVSDFFGNPEKAFGETKSYLNAAMEGAGKILVSAGDSLADKVTDPTVWARLANIFSGYGEILRGALTKAFVNSVAYLVGGVQMAVDLLPGSAKSNAKARQKEIAGQQAIELDKYNKAVPNSAPWKEARSHILALNKEFGALANVIDSGGGLEAHAQAFIKSSETAGIILQGAAETIADGKNRMAQGLALSTHVATVAAKVPTSALPKASSFISYGFMDRFREPTGASPLPRLGNAAADAAMAIANRRGTVPNTALLGHTMLDGEHHGMNKAYGQTGNIWNQISGRVGGRQKDPAEKTNEHLVGVKAQLQQIYNQNERNWGAGGGSSGGGGATTTR